MRSSIRGCGISKLGASLVSGMLVVAIALVCAAFGRQLAPYDPLRYNPREVLASPSAGHLLGTDPLGRDVFSQIIGGARVSMVVGLLSVAAGMVTGTAVGLVAGARQGRTAGLLMRAMDALLVFPSLVLALTVTAFLGASLWNVIGALAVTFVPTFAILVRGEVLALTARVRDGGAGHGRPGVARHVAAPPPEPQRCAPGAVILRDRDGDPRRGKLELPGARGAAAGAVVGSHAAQGLLVGP